ncbi:McrB family protein [Janthinobacterium sp. P210006]|uniref:McrB family protein n=1 Tax=Janthinobacterium sp. P210006 TaxID=3112939 RepID=UPI002E25AD94|nr:AAA family ATPase [Janthinobacterium sp. P210006]
MAGPTMKILCGPPGTGKTFRAAREAVKALEPERFATAQLNGNPEEAVRALHDSLVAEGRILWVTFHPSYSYEDFVEGYRPIVDEEGRLAYRVIDGPFKSLCLRAGSETDLQIGDRLVDGRNLLAGSVIDKDAGGWTVRSTPARADQVAAYYDRYVPRSVIEKVISMGLRPQIFSIPGTGVRELSDFGIDPADPDLPAPVGAETATARDGTIIKRFVSARTRMFSTVDLGNSSHYGAVMRKLLELRAAGPRGGTSVVLVIDEINRAEPSRVFGELLTLLEVDKRQGMPEEKRIWLPYSKELFTVPRDVSVIGTMNTVDRSLTALDFAMRRRFEFEYVGPETSLVSQNYGGVDVKALLSRLNSRIRMLLGAGYEFGHSYLMSSKLDAIAQSRAWDTLPDAQLRSLARVLRTALIPTLAEYFHDDWKKIRAVAGEVRSNAELISLFSSMASDPAFVERLPEEYELAESQAPVYADWWEPDAGTWDADRFKRFCIALAAGT